MCNSVHHCRFGVYYEVCQSGEEAVRLGGVWRCWLGTFQDEGGLVWPSQVRRVGCRFCAFVVQLARAVWHRTPVGLDC
jgi:hypothetical protein